MTAARFSDDSSSVAKSTSSRISSRSYKSSQSSKSKRSKSKAVRDSYKEPQKPACTPETIQSGLSQLGKAADGLRPAYLQLQVEGTNLENADAISAYEHVQTLLLRNNELVNLSALGNLHSLTSLDASGNKLTNVLGYHLPPGCDVNLRHADFSRNLVSSIDKLAAFTRLLSLDLSSNQIERVCGLTGLQMLQKLSLAGNKLISCLGLEGLSSLRELNVSGNLLMSLEPLAPLVGLELLLASGNQIGHLRGLSGLTCLRKIDIARNSIPSLDCVAHICGASLLSELMTEGNPMERCMNVRLHVVYLLPQVTLLNGIPVSAKEKVLSANMHGADAEALRAIRRKYFPRGELDDGGGALPPTSAGLIASQAEEERNEGLESEFLRVDAWARSLAPGVLTAGQGSWWRAARAAAAVTARAKAARTGRAGAAANKLGAVVEGDEEAEEEDEADREDAVGSGGDTAAAAAQAAPLLCLADQLASVCGGSQVLLARACWQWVSTHTSPPRRESTWSVYEPLFGSGPIGASGMSIAEVAEVALLSAAKVGAGEENGDGDAEAEQSSVAAGTWAERSSWLYVQLARACQLEAVMIPGYWRSGVLAPGERFEAHNHCWSGIKVNGRWRLMDTTAAALMGGGAPSAPFFVPPAALIHTYFPLEAHWQLLQEPITLDAWWDLPECSVSFFARGCKLLSSLRCVNVLPPYKEGDRMPCLQIDIAAPQQAGAYLSHTLYHAATRRPVATWPQRGFSLSSGQLAFQQVLRLGRVGSAGPAWGGWEWCVQPEQWPPGVLRVGKVSYSRGSKSTVEFGASSFPTQLTQLITSFPEPGKYFLQVQNVVELPGGLPLNVEGLPITLRLVVSDEVLRVKVVVPDPEAHDPDDGILHDSHNMPRLLPSTHPAFVRGRCELASPLLAEAAIEADRIECFEAVVPGASRVVLAGPETDDAGSSPLILAELPILSLSDRETIRPGSPPVGGPARFRAEICVPRVPRMQLLASYAAHGERLEWTTLLTIQVLPQGQHIVGQEDDIDVPEIDPSDHAALQAVELFKAMDRNQDGKVTRSEMLLAFKQNRQIADILKLPPRIHMHDGTFDRFVEGFLAIDQAKLGSYSFDELCSYMGIKPPDLSEDGSYCSDEEEGGQDDVEGGADEDDDGSGVTRPFTPE